MPLRKNAVSSIVFILCLLRFPPTRHTCVDILTLLMSHKKHDDDETIQRPV